MRALARLVVRPSKARRAQRLASSASLIADAREVHFFDLPGRVQHTGSQIPVVGEQKKPFAVESSRPDGIQAEG
jgi:hypothetical protein